MAIQAQMHSGFGFGGSQDYLILDNAAVACGLNNNNNNNQGFVSQHEHEQQLMQRVPPPPPPPRSNVDYYPSVTFSQTLSAHIENQKSEIDFFIHSQNERLRMALEEQRKQQISAVMKKYERKIGFLINQKEEEIEKAAKRGTELHDFLRRMEMERQTWERVAREKEAMAASLNSTIQRLRENAADDAESCCGGGGGGFEEEENKIEIEENDKLLLGRKCKSCNYRESCVIMLPCRHLCSCTECEAFLHSCPVCNTLKKACVEALL